MPWLITATSHPACAACEDLALRAIEQAEARSGTPTTLADAPPDVEARHYVTVVYGTKVITNPSTSRRRP